MKNIFTFQQFNENLQNDPRYNDIINDYKSGSSTRQIKDKYNIAFSTLNKMLDIAGVKRTPEEINKIKAEKSSQFRHSPETKKLLSEKRIKWLLENPDKHNWLRQDAKLSQPNEYLKNILKENDIEFIEEYKALPDRLFRIDILIPSKNLGLEVNGNQHYNKDEGKSLAPYYQIRKDVIEEKTGIELLDIHYTKVYNEDFIKQLLDYINGKIDNINIDFNFYEKEKNKCIDCGAEISDDGVRCKKCAAIKSRKVERPDLEQIKKDVEELGYSATGRKYGVSDNTIRKWIK